MKENLELPFYFYRSASALYFLFIPFPVVIFIPIFLLMIKPALFKTFEPYIFVILAIAVLLFVIGMIAIFMRKLRPQNEVLQVSGEKMYIRNKVLDLSSASISFGNFGNSASGARGTIMYIREDDTPVRMAVMGFYLDRPYIYNEEWSMKVDAFLTTENFQTLLSYLEERNEKTSPKTIPVTKFLELQLRKPLSTSQTSKIMFFILLPAVILAALLGQFSPVLSMIVILGMVGTFIYLMSKASKNPRGYDLLIEDDKIYLYTAIKTSLYAHKKLSDIKYSIYQIQIPTKYSRYGYEVLKIIFHKGQEITIANFLGTDPINRKQSFLEDLKYSFQGPEFMVDEVNFKRLTGAILKK